MPAARRSSAVSRPTGPGPTTSTRRPRIGSVSRCCQRCSCWSSMVRLRSLVNISSTPRTHSAMGRSHTPRELVTTISLSTISGVSRGSMPRLDVWIHFNRPGPTSRRSVLRKSLRKRISACSWTARSSSAVRTTETSASSRTVSSGGSCPPTGTTTIAFGRGVPAPPASALTTRPAIRWSSRAGVSGVPHRATSAGNRSRSPRRPA